MGIGLIPFEGDKANASRVADFFLAVEATSLPIPLYGGYREKGELAILIDWQKEDHPFPYPPLRGGIGEGVESFVIVFTLIPPLRWGISVKKYAK